MAYSTQPLACLQYVHKRAREEKGRKKYLVVFCFVFSFVFNELGPHPPPPPLIGGGDGVGIACASLIGTPVPRMVVFVGFLVLGPATGSGLLRQRLDSVRFGGPQRVGKRTGARFS